MTFEDLPPDWPTRPVTDPDITADVLDLVVRDADRVDGALCLLLCGEGRRLVQPLVIPRVPTTLRPDDRRRVFEALRHVVADRGFRGGVLVAVARARHAYVTDDDRAWHEAAIDALDDIGIELLGMWIVTRGVIRQMPDVRDQATA